MECENSDEGQGGDPNELEESGAGVFSNCEPGGCSDDFGTTEKCFKLGGDECGEQENEGAEDGRDFDVAEAQRSGF